MDIDGLIKLLNSDNHRQVGNTQLLMQNVIKGNAIIFFGNFHEATSAIKNFSEIKVKVGQNGVELIQDHVKNGVFALGATNFQGIDFGKKQVLFDNTAVLELLYRLNAAEAKVKTFETEQEKGKNFEEGHDFCNQIREVTKTIEVDVQHIIQVNKNLIEKNNKNSKFENQINIKITAEDSKEIEKINDDFFEGEMPDATLGRVLLRKGIQFYKKLKDNL